MSSDESTSTQISGVSSVSKAGSTAANQRRRPPEEWEINLIGNFLLTLYHRLMIGPQDDWICKKIDLRKEFGNFVTTELKSRLKKSNSGTDNIGTLLHHCGFLCNTPRGSPYYKLRSKSIFEFRNKKLAEQDKRRLNDDVNSFAAAGPENILRSLMEIQKAPTIEVNYEIDEDSPVHTLKYEGTTMQQRRPNYFPTNLACCICQKDFSTMTDYEEHIETHNDETDFEFLKELSQFDTPIFSLSYRGCKNSHNFCFTIKTETVDLVIEKIIIVQSRSMFHVHNMRVPYDMPASGSENFYVDSHLFTIFVEQPVILICHLKNSKQTRIIEEHHFMRSFEFPKVNFAIRPYRLPFNKTFKPKFKLPDYFPPIEIRHAIKDDFIYEKLMKTSNEFRDYVRNGKILQPQTIGQTLTTLLHIEDMDAIKDYLNLVQHNVSLRNFGDNYSMRLRPKQRIHIENILSVFDEAIVTTRSDLKANSEELLKFILKTKDELDIPNTYVCQLEDVNSGRVSFRSFKRIDLKRNYTIVFRPSRTQLRYQYRAMELLPVVMDHLRKFLFPAQLLPKTPSTLSLQLYNKTIYDNPEQLQAVRNIAEGPRNDATYIIFGPPGTGKTTTLVESILQVLKKDDTKILVTASSNSACDEVALRLCKTLSTFDMSRAIVRIYAMSNEARIDTIDDVLLEHSNMYSVHFYPDIEVLHEYRVVVCTMSVVAKLATGKFGRRENGGTLYTHMFIDEVAASTEVEALMAITSILTPKSCLIISGDHKQLGPVVKSKRAEEFNLGVSLMDRLLARECYRVNTDTGNYDRTVQSRLRLNFRSHPAIVNLYSGMYYNHDLEAKAKIENVSLVKDWHLAPNNDFPIIFHSVLGKSYSDNHSFSLYNSEEINIVMDYVKDLMFFGINGKHVEESDIGIISPYKKQYLRIREELNLRKWYLIETGSVETFQGKEKQIIIVSFVRSGTATLGFLDSPRRLNVTLSRAKSLLVLIGNANTLSINPDYDYIIKECQRHKTLVGGLNTSYAIPKDEADSVKNNDNYRIPASINTKENINKINRNFRDLKLKNHNAEKSKSNRQRHGRQRNANKKQENMNKNDKEEGEDASSDDDDEDESDEEDDNDNKPSTSKATGKPNLGQNMKQKNQAAGKISKSYKGEKQNAKKQPTKIQQPSKDDLEEFFKELPTVPKNTNDPIKPPTANNSNQKQHLNNSKQMPSIQQHQSKPNYNNCVPIQQQQNQFRFPPSNTQNNMTMGHLNYMVLGPQQPMPRQLIPQSQNNMGAVPRQPILQQNFPHQQIQEQIRQQQMLLQQSIQQQQWHQHHQIQQQRYQLQQPNILQQNVFGTANNNNAKTNPFNNNMQPNDNKQSRRSRTKGNEKEPKKEQENDNTASTSKVDGKAHLAQSMKKKKQVESFENISTNKISLFTHETIKTIPIQQLPPQLLQRIRSINLLKFPNEQTQQNSEKENQKQPKNIAQNANLKNVSQAITDTSKPIAMPKATALNIQTPKKDNKNEQEQSSKLPQQQQTITNKIPSIAFQNSGIKTSKVVANIRPTTFSNDTAKANVPTTISSTNPFGTTRQGSTHNSAATIASIPALSTTSTSGSQYASTALNRSTTVENIYPTISRSSTSPNSLGTTRQASTPNAATIFASRPTLSTTSTSGTPISSTNPFGTTRQGSTQNSAATTSGSQYSSAALNRSSAVENPTNSRASTSSGSNDLNLKFDLWIKSCQTAGTNGNTTQRSSSIQQGAEALNFNRTPRPVRNLSEEHNSTKKKDNCVIA